MFRLFIPESLHQYPMISEFDGFEAIQDSAEKIFLLPQLRMPFPIVGADPLRGQFGQVRFKGSDKCGNFLCVQFEC